MSRQTKAKFTTLIYILERYLLPIFFLASGIASIAKSVNPFDVIKFLDDVVKPILFAIFLNKTTSRERILNPTIIIGLLLSFLPLVFFKAMPNKFGLLTSTFSQASLLFYLLIFVLSIINLGSAFTIIPAKTNPQLKGMYAHITHPIYSSYIHFFICLLAINFSPTNLLIVSSLFVGLYLRSIEEEKILYMNEEYMIHSKKKNRFFSPIITFPAVVLIVYIATSQSSIHQEKIQVKATYPVYSLAPHQADDWTSFFVMNHIYLRLQGENGKFRERTPFKNLSLECSDNRIQFGSADCKRIKVNYVFDSELVKCNNSPYTESDFRFEIQEILKAKNWLLPNFKFCDDRPSCFTFDSTQNVHNHLESIYLRFGWNSIGYPKGIKPNCFYPKDSNILPLKDGQITTPDYLVSISTNNDEADLVLYGDSSSPKVKFINFYNPIHYFLVISGIVSDNIPLAKLELEMKRIRDAFYKESILSEEKGFQILKSPEVLPKKRNVKSRKTQLLIVLPDFIQNCESISRKLTSETFKYICQNITQLVEEQVKKDGKWQAFISPLTPGLPGPNALQEQYFSTKSHDSWLGRSMPDRSVVFFLGSTKGTIQVNENSFCSITPNSLGLSDLTVDDLHRCKD